MELNSSFYAIPDRNTVRGWVEATPDDFVFDVKVHRALSRHAAPLDSLPPDLREAVEDEPARPRAAHRRSSRRRWPRGWWRRRRRSPRRASSAPSCPAHARLLARKNELEELDGLVSTPAPRPVAMELRHRAWVADKRIDATLGGSRRGAAFVCVDAPAGEHVPIMPPIDATTRDDLAYVRIHGRNTEGYMHGKTVAERFGWRYEDEELEEIGEPRPGLAESAGDVHVMFNNNRDDDAPTAARRFRALLGQEPGGEERLTLMAAWDCSPGAVEGEVERTQPDRGAQRLCGMRWRCAHPRLRGSGPRRRPRARQLPGRRGRARPRCRPR